MLAALIASWLFTWWQTGVIARTYPAAGAFIALGDGTRIHYTERRPSGQPRASVVLLHGASGNQADVMLPLGDRLARLGFRVIAPDRPGHGWSDRSHGAQDASPARQAQMLLEAFRSIGISNAIVVGHSWSGALAAEMALDHPDFVDGLVLLAPVLYPWPGGVAWYYDLAAMPGLGWAFAHLAVMPLGLRLLPAGIDEVFAPGPPPPGYAETTGVYLTLRPSEFTANAEDVLALHAFVTEQGPRMRGVRTPTAIVVGDGDKVVSPQLHGMRAAREIAGARLTVLHGVGHSPHWADPDSAVDAVLDVEQRSRQRSSAAAR